MGVAGTISISAGVAALMAVEEERAVMKRGPTLKDVELHRARPSLYAEYRNRPQIPLCHTHTPTVTSLAFRAA